EREAVVGILAQAVDAAIGSQRKLSLREEVGTARQPGQQAADPVEVGVRYAALLDRAGLVDQLSHRLRTLPVHIRLCGHLGSLRLSQYSPVPLSAKAE